jgi:tRNA(Ile)-lysidine synthase
MPILETISQVLQDRCELDITRPVLLGVSGGPDSLCMLHLMWRLGWKLVVAHLDHRLRPDSSLEADRVASAAEHLGIPFILGRENVQEFGDSQGLSLEEAARLVRYQFLFTEADRMQVQAVAVAHTADDQVETVLMHLLRGSGMAGLTGMEYHSLPSTWSSQRALVRPLLGTWRSEIDEYLQANHLAPVLDPSNTDVRFYRNYLRHEVLPYLEAKHPHLRQRLWNMSDILREERAVLEDLVGKSWEKCRKLDGKGFVVLDLENFNSLMVGLRRNLVRRAFTRLRPGLRDIEYSVVQAVVEFAQFPSMTQQRDLALGLRVFIEQNEIWLAAWEADLPASTGAGDCWPQVINESASKLEVPGIVDLNDGWQLSLEIFPSPVLETPEFRKEDDPFVAWIDASVLREPLSLRYRRPGERFQPFGMAGKSLKLSDFMINQKLPRRARPRWPLVVSGESIVWVPGLRLAHPFRLTPGTQQAVRLVLQRNRQAGDI